MNIITWYKNKMKELVAEGGYVNTASVRLVDSEGHKIRDISWLFEDYTPEEYKVLSISDDIEFVGDIPFHVISILLKEIEE